MSKLSYTAGYYQSIREDSAASAREVVPLIMRLFSPRSVVDVGCGPGTWAAEYKRAGAAVLGMDGYDVKTEQLLIPPQEFDRRNLAEPVRLDRRFDLVNCLEVANRRNVQIRGGNTMNTKDNGPDDAPPNRTEDRNFSE